MKNFTAEQAESAGIVHCGARKGGQRDSPQFYRRLVLAAKMAEQRTGPVGSEVRDC